METEVSILFTKFSVLPNSFLYIQQTWSIIQLDPSEKRS